MRKIVLIDRTIFDAKGQKYKNQYGSHFNPRVVCLCIHTFEMVETGYLVYSSPNWLTSKDSKSIVC